jgi:hypothetical protein
MLAERVARVLEMGDVDALGDLLHVSWLHKQRLTTGISTSFIDHCYATAREAGACGGKITGAGGGGFLLLDCPPERHDAVTSALMPLGLQPFTFRLERAPAGVVAHLPTEVRQTGQDEGWHGPLADAGDEALRRGYLRVAERSRGTRDGG